MKTIDNAALKLIGSIGVGDGIDPQHTIDNILQYASKLSDLHRKKYLDKKSGLLTKLHRVNSVFRGGDFLIESLLYKEFSEDSLEIEAISEWLDRISAKLCKPNSQVEASQSRPIARLHNLAIRFGAEVVFVKKEGKRGSQKRIYTLLRSSSRVLPFYPVVCPSEISWFEDLY